MSKYLQLAKWATDLLFPFGSNPWNSTQTKIQPADAIQAAGAVPDQQFPAQEFNWLINDLQSSIDVLAHSALQTWRFSSPPINGANGNTQLVAMSVPGLAQRILFAFEADTTHSGNTWTTRSNDGSSWLAKVGMSPTFANLTDAAPGAAGVIMLVNGSSASVQYTTDGGVTWANLSFGAAARLAVHYGLGQYWACGTLQVWTASTIAGLGGGAQPALPIPGSGLFSGVPEFADNDANTVCLVGVPSGGVTYPSVYATTDLGVTWTKVFDLTGATAANLKYDTSRGLFVTWDDTGAVSTSPNGTVWTRGTALTGSPSRGVVIGPRTFAIAGNVIAKLWLESVGGQNMQGIAYSFDLGVSWFVWAFGTNSTPLTQLRAANNRLYAIDGFNLWTSGVLGSNDKDF